LQAALNNAGQRFKAASGVTAASGMGIGMGHRFFPYNQMMRPFFLNAQQSILQHNNKQQSPPLLDKLSPDRIDKKNAPSMSISPINSPLSNNCSNESNGSVSNTNSNGDKVQESHSNSNKMGLTISNSVASSSPIPELKNIQRMVEGLDTRGARTRERTPIFVPTTVAS